MQAAKAALTNMTDSLKANLEEDDAAVLDVVTDVLLAGGTVAEVGGVFEKSASTTDEVEQTVCFELTSAALGGESEADGASACKATATPSNTRRRLQAVPMSVDATLCVLS